MEICSFRYIPALLLFVNELRCAESRRDCEMVIDFGNSQTTSNNPIIQGSIIVSEAHKSSLENINPISIPFEGLQSTSASLPNEPNIELLKKLEEPCDKTVTLESGVDASFSITVNGDQAQKQKLLDLFNGLNNELSDFTKFYDYYDVLTFIDKSIALIQELECAPKINVSRNSMIRKKMIALITCNHKNLEDLYGNVENLYKQNESNKDKFNYMIDGLTDIKKRKEDLKEQFERYKDDGKTFQIAEYQKYDCQKVFQLNELGKELKEIREKICPVNEQDLQNNADNYKNSFKKKVSYIYTELFECHEKEKKSFQVLFDVYENILEGIDDAIARLNSFNDDLSGGKSKAE